MLRISVVGLGMAVKPHASALLNLGDQVEVVWGAARSEARTAAFAQATGFPVTTDVTRALTDPAIDAVLLLTPPDTHLALGRVALEAGKHVLVEKPLDRTLADAQALVALAAARGRTLGVVLQHRFRDAALRLAALVDAGELGTLALASVTVPWWRPQSYYDEPGRGTLARDGGGVLVTQAIHVVDLFRALTGPVEVVAADATTTPAHRMETEDTATALLRLRDGAPGVMLTTTAFYPGLPERIEIAGTEASATLTGDALEVRWLDGDGRGGRFGRHRRRPDGLLQRAAPPPDRRFRRRGGDRPPPARLRRGGPRHAAPDPRRHHPRRRPDAVTDGRAAPPPSGGAPPPGVSPPGSRTPLRPGPG